MTQNSLEERLAVIETEVAELRRQSESRQQDVDRIHNRKDSLASEDGLKILYDRLNSMNALILGGFVITIGGGVALKLFS